MDLNYPIRTQSGRCLFSGCSIVGNWRVVSIKHCYLLKKSLSNALCHDYILEKSCYSKKSNDCAGLSWVVFLFQFCFCVGNRGCLTGESKQRSRFVEFRLWSLDQFYSVQKGPCLTVVSLFSIYSFFKLKKNCCYGLLFSCHLFFLVFLFRFLSLHWDGPCTLSFHNQFIKNKCGILGRTCVLHFPLVWVDIIPCTNLCPKLPGPPHPPSTHTSVPH